MRGLIFDIKEFAVHDGAGIRTTVFMKGCPLACVWCHNPEGQKSVPELMKKSGCENCGRCKIPCEHPDCAPYGVCLHACPKGLISLCGYYAEAVDIARRLIRDRDIFRSSGGGVTISGGEPLAQGGFVTELLELLGEAGINRAIETCGYADEKLFRSVIGRCDFVYCDIKLADSAEHEKYTGVRNERILSNIAVLRASGVPYKLRVPLIPGITDTEENLAAIRELTEPGEVEYLPSNKLAGAKYPMLGRKYPL